MAVHAKKEVKNLNNLVKIYSKVKKSTKKTAKTDTSTGDVKESKVEVRKQDIIRDAIIIAFIGVICVIGYLLAKYANF